MYPEPDLKTGHYQPLPLTKNHRMVILYLTVSNLTNILSVIPQIFNAYFPITGKLANESHHCSYTKSALASLK